VCAHILDDFHIFTASDARSLPPSLTLFSFDGETIRRAFSALAARGRRRARRQFIGWMLFVVAVMIAGDVYTWFTAHRVSADSGG
jgi:hypothetical protein